MPPRINRNRRKHRRRTAAQDAQVQPETQAQQEEDTSGIATKNKLRELLIEKKKAKITDPDVWIKLCMKYGKPKAAQLTNNQVDELIKDIIRGEVPT